MENHMLNEIINDIRPFLAPIAISLILFLKRTTIARITAEIKFTFDNKIEELKHQNTKKELVHKLQFETEFSAYKELWAEVCEWRRVFRQYKSKMLSMDESVEGGFENKQKIYFEAYDSFQHLFDNMVKMKPFLYGEVHTELESIIHEYDKELQEYFGHQRHGMKSGWYDERSKVLKELDQRF